MAVAPQVEVATAVREAGRQRMAVATQVEVASYRLELRMQLVFRLKLTDEQAGFAQPRRDFRRAFRINEYSPANVSVFFCREEAFPKQHPPRAVWNVLQQLSQRAVNAVNRLDLLRIESPATNILCAWIVAFTIPFSFDKTLLSKVSHLVVLAASRGFDGFRMGIDFKMLEGAVHPHHAAKEVTHIFRFWFC